MWIKIFRILIACLLLSTSSFASTRAVQIDMLLSGLLDPNTLEPVSAGTVYFYEAGTTTAKNVWTEKEKTSPYTSYTLSDAGVAQLYGEGEYKIVVKDSGGTTLYTWDDIKLKHPNYYVHSISTDYTQTSADDLLLVDTTGGAITISGLPAADWEAPLKIILVNGSNTVTYDPDGSETIDGDATRTVTTGLAAEIVSDGSNLRSVGGARTSLIDTDQDTQVQVEESADEDKIRGDVGGDEKLLISGDATESYIQVNALADEDNDTKVEVESTADVDTVTIDVGGDEKLLLSADATASYIQANALVDEDGDTFVQVEESADEDKIRIDTGGTERVVCDSTGFRSLEPIAVNTTTAPDSGEDILIQAVQGTGNPRIQVADSQGASKKVVHIEYNVSGAEGILAAYDYDADEHLPLDLHCSALYVNDMTQPIAKFIDIGDWNMDTTGTVQAAHGLTYADIKYTEVSIRDDPDSTLYDINAGGYAYANATNVVMVRTASGIFDSASFDSTSYNRGYIIVWYMPSAW